MGKHKTKEEWIYWFKKYESNNLIWSEYFKKQKISNSSKAIKSTRERFRKKYRDYKMYGSSIIISMTEKSKGNGRGRPKKNKIPDFSKWKKEELEKVARRYFEITKDKKKSEKDKEASSLNLPEIKIAQLLDISRSGLYYQKQKKSRLDPKIKSIITKTFWKYNGIFGRDRIAALTGINYRRVGRYLKALNLVCKARKAKKNRERKNTLAKYHDLVKRNYIQKKVIATDVSYIQTNKGFAYLSIAINHHTKKIESWNFAKENDNKLVIDHLKKLNLKE